MRGEKEPRQQSSEIITKSLARAPALFAQPLMHAKLNMVSRFQIFELIDEGTCVITQF